MRMRFLAACVAIVVVLTAGVVSAAEWGLKAGNPELKSASILAFGPDGILLVGDTKAATVFAIDTQDASGEPGKVSLNIEGLNAKVAEALGGSAADTTINDLAVNPLSGNVYLAITSGKDDAAKAALLRLDAAGKLSPVKLEGVKFSKVALPNAPEDKVVGEGKRQGNRRLESITDIAYTDGKVLISGVASGESPSNVREIAFPFVGADVGTSIEIYHGAHGKLEDTATVRVFVPFNINGEASLLAGFTCTPLVKFPVSSLEAGKKVRGTTVAELGNRNKPLDMIVYEKDGKTFLLMANSARGVMKISTQDIGRDTGITEPIGGGGTAGQTYETIADLQGVIQLDRLNDKQAVILVNAENGVQNLRTIALP